MSKYLYKGNFYKTIHLFNTTEVNIFTFHFQDVICWWVVISFFLSTLFLESKKNNVKKLTKSQEYRKIKYEYGTLWYMYSSFIANP